MVTALALYSGRALSEFELVGMMTDPAVIKQVLAIIADDDPNFLLTLRSRLPTTPPLSLIY